MNCPFKPLGNDPTLLEFTSTDIPPRTPPASPPAGPQPEEGFEYLSTDIPPRTRPPEFPWALLLLGVAGYFLLAR